MKTDEDIELDIHMRKVSRYVRPDPLSTFSLPIFGSPLADSQLVGLFCRLDTLVAKWQNKQDAQQYAWYVLLHCAYFAPNGRVPIYVLAELEELARDRRRLREAIALLESLGFVTLIKEESALQLDESIARCVRLYANAHTGEAVFFEAKEVFEKLVSAMNNSFPWCDRLFRRKRRFEREGLRANEKDTFPEISKREHQLLCEEPSACATARFGDAVRLLSNLFSYGLFAQLTQKDKLAMLLQKLSCYLRFIKAED